ncbi:MAG: SMP-30/gluconolactonase/LRE family protein [Hyphomicrobiales bacterium]|nr:MAG: SMP-30/gluconolactonase/LRE family protein [Hyphomicrobiales bacterium]
MQHEPEVAVPAQATLGEGVNWDPNRQCLYWVDILEKELHVYDPAADSDRCINVGQYIGAAVPTAAGDVMLALHHGFYRLDLEMEALTPVCDPEADLPENRFNDGKCDPAGRFWAGTMQLEGRGTTGALYRMDTDLSVHKQLGDVGISNGLAWSPDHATMYYIDTVTSEVAAFDYDLADGAIANRRAVITFTAEMGHPDGMTIDTEGMLWVCFFGGGRIARYNPGTGEALDEIRFPVSNVSNCVFGGSDLDTLYVSTARLTLSDAQLAEQPLAGSVFRVKPGVCGLAAVAFGGV